MRTYIYELYIWTRVIDYGDFENRIFRVRKQLFDRKSTSLISGHRNFSMKFGVQSKSATIFPNFESDFRYRKRTGCYDQITPTYHICVKFQPRDRRDIRKVLPVKT